ncbi:serine acetyltransferase [Vibrio sp. 03-59-1]|uniref:Serine acetyltransferase n=2 Tax=Vibrio TaxID=662 RepID=A0A1E5CMS5_9VIBR|nr:serine acetyltransferase [Vibrio sp. 03-59-1]OEE71106.1 serine acetyltransferase [Vibrio genomosp. F6 str. FF-238]
MLINLMLIGKWCNSHHLSFVSKIIYAIQFFLFNSSLPHSAIIGKGSKFAYGGIGCVIHKRARVGKNCTFGQNITIGGRSKHVDVPIIGDNVYIGAGARVLGPINIGDNVIIAPNAVVISDVPPSTIVGGIPAKVIKSDIDPSNFI